MKATPNGESHMHLLQSSPYLLLVALVTSGLTTSLVTRTFHLTVSHTLTIKSGSPQATRQHLDRDAAQWASPSPHAIVPHISSVTTRLKLPDPVFPVFVFTEGLYNRPPPTC